MDQLDFVVNGLRREIDAIGGIVSHRSNLLELERENIRRLDYRVRMVELAARSLGQKHMTNEKEVTKQSERLTRMEKIQLVIIYSLGLLGVGNSDKIAEVLLASLSR